MWVRPGHPCLPELLPPTAEVPASESQDGVGSSDRPAHSGLFEAATDDGLAAGLDHTGADEEALLTELGVPHPLGVGLEILGGLAQFVLGVYLARDLLLDDLVEVFLSLARSDTSPSSPGRVSQIASLISSSCAVSERKRR